MIYTCLDRKGLIRLREWSIAAGGSFRAKGGGWRGWRAEAQSWSSGEMPCTSHQPAFAVQQGWSKSREKNQIQAGASDCQASPEHWGRLGEARGESACHSGSLWISGVQGQGTASTSGVKWTPAVTLCRAVPLPTDKRSTDNVCEWRMVLLIPANL